MQGGTLNCQGFPCKQKIVSLTRHRRLAGRDPTARRWSPERRNQECRYGERRSRVLLHTFMVKCICLSSVCSASSVVKLYWRFFVNFRAFRG